MSNEYKEFLNAYTALLELEEDYLRTIVSLEEDKADIERVKSFLYDSISRINDNEAKAASALLIKLGV